MIGDLTIAPVRAVRYEWTFEMGEGLARYTGTDSAHLLSSVFAMWLKDRGDVSEWKHAALLGGLVHTYSDLSLPVVAVWLGIDPSDVWGVAVPPSEQPWEIPGPTGESLRIDRTVEVNSETDGVEND